MKFKYINPPLYLYSFLVLVLIVIIYFQIFPLKVIDVKHPYTVLSTTVNSGDDLSLKVEYCKYLPAEVEFYVQYFNIDTNEVIATTPKQLSDLSVGCWLGDNAVTFKWPTPVSMSSGTVYGVAHGLYRLNWFQSIFYEDRYVTKTEEFEVVNQKSIREIIQEVSAVINNYYLVDESEEGSGVEKQEDGSKSDPSAESSDTKGKKNKKGI